MKLNPISVLGIGLVTLGWALLVFGPAGDPVYATVFTAVLHTGFFLIIVGVVWTGFAAVCQELRQSRAVQGSARPGSSPAGGLRGHRIEPTLRMDRDLGAPRRVRL